MEVKNVIIICDVSSFNGGAAKVALQTAIGLSELGLNVLLFSAVGPVDAQLQRSNVKVCCLGQKDILSDENRVRAMTQGIWNGKAYSQFRKLLKQYSPEDTVIHSHVLIKALSPSVWAVLAEYDFKVFVTLHDYFLFCPNGGMFNYRKKEICDLRGSSLKCYITNCDVRNYYHKLWRDVRQIVQFKMFSKIKDLNLISISSLNKQVCYPYLNGYAKGWYELQNPIELNENSPVQIEQNEYYLFLGRLSPEKGLDLFCEAITTLHLKGLVVGDGDLREEYSNRYPNIRFVGWATGERKDAYIRQCKAMVLPSRWYEGAPLSVVELKSYGLPCIVPDRCAAREEVEDGKTGIVFRSGDLNSLVNAIKQYETMDLSAMQRAILDSFDPDIYSLNTHCRKLLELYQHNTDCREH